MTMVLLTTFLIAAPIVSAGNIDIFYSFDGVSIEDGGTYTLPFGIEKEAMYSWSVTGSEFRGHFSLLDQNSEHFPFNRNHDLGDESPFITTDFFPGPGNYSINIDGFSEGYVCGGGDFCIPDLFGEVQFTVMEEVQHPPTITLLKQFKIFGIDELNEGDTTTNNTIIFKADLNDPDNDQVKLEVEVKETGVPFDGTDTFFSDIVPSGTQASTTKENLISKADIYTPNNNIQEFHWRARAVDEQGMSSDWQEFGTPDNTDFTVRVVPLYTQVESSYPSWTATAEWAGEQYGTGNYPECFDETLGYSTIGDCGCAITSAVMVLQYYGIENDVDGNNVNPGTFNTWLQNATTTPRGYYSGNINWKAIDEYARDPNTNNFRVVFNGKDDGTPQNQFVKNILDTDLAFFEPVILRHDAFGHFLVATEKLSDTYTVRDPFSYNTLSLNHNLTAEDIVLPFNNYKKDYDNHYDGIRRLFALGTYDTRPVYYASIGITIGSPAELLITDPQGRKLGKDPINNIEYNEIPNSSYTKDGISDPENPIPHSDPIKSVWIPNPLDGEYEIKVIGTGEGDYTLYSSLSDDEGNLKSDTFYGIIQTNEEEGYSLDYDSEDSDNSEIEPVELTTEELIQLFKNTLNETEMSRRLKRRIKFRMRVAEILIEHDRIRPAKRILNSTIRLIERRSGRGIEPEDAEILINIIKDIKSSL